MDEKLLKKIFGDVPIVPGQRCYKRSDWAKFSVQQNKTVCFKNNNGVVITCNVNGNPIKLSGKLSRCRQDIISFMRNNGVHIFFVYYGTNAFSGSSTICAVEVL